MIAYFKNSYLSFFIWLLGVLFINKACLSQDTTQTKFPNRLETAEIQWFGQWSSYENNGKASGIANRIKDFILGKKTQALSKPISILANNQNTFWILDQGNNAIFQVSMRVGNVPNFIEKKKFKFSSLVGISDFCHNKILFSDSYLQKIFLLDPEKKECVVLNDSLALVQPTGIAYSKIKNEIWVVETGAHRISVLNEKGELIKRIGSRGTAKGEFNFPTNIWINKEGNIYIVDAMNFRVQVFNKEGEIISVFGSNGDATGYFACPKGIATDSYGHIYVVDALLNVVQIFDINGNFLYNFGAQGHGPEQFWMPSGIYIDANDFIYVADSYNSRIQIFHLTNCIKK